MSGNRGLIPLTLLACLAALVAGFVFTRLLMNALGHDVQPAGQSTEDLYEGWF